MKKDIITKTKHLRDKLISHRKFLHENAEVGFDTLKTSKYIYETLSSIGAECSYFDDNSVVGTIHGSPNGKTILLRADIDALSLTEETALAYACKTGNMHACGHDMHTSMLLCAIEVLMGMKEKICGNVKFLFQPAEEILSGAKRAVEKGILDDVDMAMTVHVMTNTEIPTGSVLLSYDCPAAPSADFFSMSVVGKGCHGSSPSTGIDPISCACRIVTAIEHIKTHEIGIHDKAVLTFGKINGGSNANAIPDVVTLMGTLRCFDEQTRLFYKKRLEEISKGIASAFRCECKTEYTSSCPALINDNVLLSKTADNLSELLGERSVIKIKDTRSKVQGSEDFAYISQKVPSVTVAIAAGKTSEGYKYPLHNPNVIFDENALEVGCSVFAYNALKLLQK